MKFPGSTALPITLSLALGCVAYSEESKPAPESTESTQLIKVGPKPARQTASSKSTTLTPSKKELEVEERDKAISRMRHYGSEVVPSIPEPIKLQNPTRKITAKPQLDKEAESANQDWLLQALKDQEERNTQFEAEVEGPNDYLAEELKKEKDKLDTESDSYIYEVYKRDQESYVEEEKRLQEAHNAARQGIYREVHSQLGLTEKESLLVKLETHSLKKAEANDASPMELLNTKEKPNTLLKGQPESGLTNPQFDEVVISADSVSPAVNPPVYSSNSYQSSAPTAQPVPGFSGLPSNPGTNAGNFTPGFTSPDYPGSTGFLTVPGATPVNPVPYPLAGQPNNLYPNTRELNPAQAEQRLSQMQQPSPVPIQPGLGGAQAPKPTTSRPPVVHRHLGIRVADPNDF